jgi:hypothetical protein
MATGRMGVAYVVEVYPQGGGALRVDGVLFGGTLGEGFPGEYATAKEARHAAQVEEFARGTFPGSPLMDWMTYP